MKTLTNKHNKLKQLIKENIRRILLQEGMQITPNTYLSMYEDNIILTQGLGGNSGDTGQKIEINLNDLPKVMDIIFNTVPIDYFPVNYRQSFIAKLSDKAINQDTDLSGKPKDEKPAGDKKADKDEKAPADEPTEAPAGEDENPFA